MHSFSPAIAATSSPAKVAGRARPRFGLLIVYGAGFAYPTAPPQRHARHTARLRPSLPLTAALFRIWFWRPRRPV
jgi:hypothetical protein